MKCTKCGNPANHFFSQTINGETSMLFLCNDCLLQGGVIKFAHSVKPNKINNITCPKCKIQLNEFLQSGYLGCPDCYTAFNNEIEKILPQMQVGSRHKGKALTQTPLTPEQKISRLKAEMDRAASEQRFDDAKKLYNEIIKAGGKV